MKFDIRRILHRQAERLHVYCIEKDMHLTVTDPSHPYSGDPHKIELTECDCEANVTPSTPTGEEDDHGTQQEPEAGSGPEEPHEPEAPQSYGGTSSEDGPVEPVTTIEDIIGIVPGNGDTAH